MNFFLSGEIDCADRIIRTNKYIFILFVLLVLVCVVDYTTYAVIIDNSVYKLFALTFFYLFGNLIISFFEMKKIRENKKKTFLLRQQNRNQ